jgi:hypothetical protein
MSGKTPNYNLTLPELDEYYDIGVHNENYSILDEKIGENQSKVDDLVGSLAEVATSGNYNDLENTPDISTVGGSGAFNDLVNKPFTVVKYASQLQEALDALDETAGGTIYLLPGTYSLSGISLYQHNVTIVGSGAGTVLELGDNNIFINSLGITFRDLTITRSVESDKPLVSILDNNANLGHICFNSVTFDCNQASATNGLIGVNGNISGLFIIGCYFVSDKSNYITYEIATDVSSIQGKMIGCYARVRMYGGLISYIGCSNITEPAATASEEA